MEELIIMKRIRKEYARGGVRVNALDGVNFSVRTGEFTAIVGASGSGKSTLMNIIGCLDTPTSGYYALDGCDVSSLSERELSEIRNKKIGFVFQGFHLIPGLTALENVELARQVCKDALDPLQVMRQVGLESRLNNFPAQLSGGEQQRVSIARALCKNPALLLCDEPTGALDSKTGIQVLRLLTQISREHGTTVVVITHNASIAPLGNRVIQVKNGGIESVTLSEHPASVEEIAW